MSAGLRPAVEPGRRTFASSRPDPRCSRPARSTVDTWRWAATSVRVRPAASAPRVPAIGLVPIPDAGGCSLRCSRTDPVETPICDAVALGTFRTRLETRTKESSMCASHWDTTKPKGAMKVKVRLARTEGRWAVRPHGRPPRIPGASRSHREERRTKSVHAGTRKMVNYAWSGRSQGKP